MVHHASRRTVALRKEDDRWGRASLPLAVSEVPSACPCTRNGKSSCQRHSGRFPRSCSADSQSIRLGLSRWQSVGQTVIGNEPAQARVVRTEIIIRHSQAVAGELQFVAENQRFERAGLELMFTNSGGSHIAGGYTSSRWRLSYQFARHTSTTRCVEVFPGAQRAIPAPNGGVISNSPCTRPRVSRRRHACGSRRRTRPSANKTPEIPMANPLPRVIRTTHSGVISNSPCTPGDVAERGRHRQLVTGTLGGPGRRGQEYQTQ